MLSKINEFIEEIKEKYGNEVKIKKNSKVNLGENRIPNELKSLYDSIDSAYFPFGEIFSKDVAVKRSNQEPFKGKWFVFGWDGYFTYWLCSYNKNEDGASFTYWDHESGNDIEEAEWNDIYEFLTEIEEDYQDSL